MGPTIDSLLGDELPYHPEWDIDQSTSQSCVWRRRLPSETPHSLFSVVLMWRDGWSVSYAYQVPKGDKTQLSVDLDWFDTLDEALTAIQTRLEEAD